MTQKSQKLKPVDRIGITTNEIHENFPEAVQIGLGWGIRNFELRKVWGPVRVPNLSPQQEKILYDTFESKGLTCTALSPGTFMGPYDENKLDEQFEQLDKCFNMAERLKTSIIIVFSFQRGDAAAGAVMPSKQVQALREAARRAADRGITLALENMLSQWGDTTRNVRMVLEKVDYPSFRLNWDPGNSAIADEPVIFPDGYERIQEFMVYFHLKNYNLGRESIPVPNDYDVFSVLREGEIDYEAHLKRVVDDGYDGWFVLETHRKPYEENTRLNLGFLRETFSKL